MVFRSKIWIYSQPRCCWNEMSKREMSGLRHPRVPKSYRHPMIFSRKAHWSLNAISVSILVVNYSGVFEVQKFFDHFSSSKKKHNAISLLGVLLRNATTTALKRMWPLWDPLKPTGFERIKGCAAEV